MNKPHIRPSRFGFVIGFGRDAPFVYLCRGTTLAEAWENFLRCRQVAWAFAMNGYPPR